VAELGVKVRKRDGAMTGEEQIALDERGTKKVVLSLGMLALGV
jgi:hypothetical protein